jgi:hypothetical protein
MQYSIYLARIEGVSSSTDSRLQVRILPDMEDLSRDYLPMWPSFFRNEMITGKPGALVWVIANKEYTMGYVLGYANFYTWKDDYKDASIPSDLFDRIDDGAIDLRGKILNYSDTQVMFWNENTLHFIERSTGASIIAYRNGTIHSVEAGEIVAKVGQSILRITGEEIVLSSPSVRIEGEVKLGTNPQGQVFISSGPKGNNTVPSKDVWA